NQRLLNGWFSVQASADLPDTVERVSQLLKHFSFSFFNFESVNHLVFDFVKTNPRHFHRRDGAGYRLLAGVILKARKP
ncbi:hypothetical protein, conserved, partial [Eimeria tenella]